MKLQTSTKPRRDGTVKVTGQDRQTYVFAADESGVLTCDIEHEPTIAFLLANDNYFPADPADHAKALAITEGSTDPEGEADDEDDEDADDEVEVVNGGLPLEANTPPQAAPDMAAKHNDAVIAAAKPAKGKGGAKAK